MTISMNVRKIKGVSVVIACLLVLFVVIGCTAQQAAQQENEAQQDAMPTAEDGETEETEATTQPVEETTGPVQIVVVTEAEWKITLDKKEIPAGKTKFIITNNGPKWPHAFRIVDKSTGKSAGDQVSVNLDEVDTLEITLQPGTYEIYCPMSGHKDKGMVTSLTVK